MRHLTLSLILIASLFTFGCEQKPAADSEEPTTGAEGETPEGAPAEGEKGEEAEEPEAPAQSGAEDAKEQGGLPEDIKEGEEKKYGGDFTIEEDPMALASVLEKADEHTGKPIKVSATLDKVCKKKGCWFTLADDSVDETVRVRMKDYGFFVPRNADGSTAIVEGVLEKKVIPEAEAQHYADESGETKKVEGDQTEYHFIATAVQLKKAKS